MMSETEEEMVENGDEEDEEEPSWGGSPASSSSTPPSSPSGPQKRPLSSTSSHSPLPYADPFRKKTRDLPNIYNCHSCGLRFPDKGRSERLQPLDSQWRIVLLCKACLQAIRSAEACSYCFVSFEKEDEGFICCRKCSARVHLGCLPKQRGYLAASDLDPDLFLCVDCCAFPTSPIKKRSNFRDSCATKVSSISPEDVVRSAKAAAAKKLELAARAKEKALAKAVAAKHAAELARSALDLVVVTGKKPPACTQATVTVTDEKLALQLHRAINGSQRISRNSCPENSDCSIDCNKGRFDTNLAFKDSESGSSNIYGTVELCMEDTLYETLGVLDAKLLTVIGTSEENYHVHIGMGEGVHQNKEANKYGKGNPQEVPTLEEQGSCSDVIVNSTGDDNSVDSVSVPYPSSSGPSTLLSTFQQDAKCNMPDRYLKKYCKRPSRMKDTKQNGGSASLLVPVSQ